MPAICSPRPAWVLASSFKSPVWGVPVNGGVTPPAPAICGDPGQAAQAAVQARKLTSTPAEGISKDLMNPCFSSHSQILFPLSRKRIFPLTSAGLGFDPSRWVCMWQRVSELGWTEHLTQVPYPFTTEPPSEPKAFCFFQAALCSPRGLRVPHLQELALCRYLHWFKHGVDSPAEPCIAVRILQTDGSYKEVLLKPVSWHFVEGSR